MASINSSGNKFKAKNCPKCGRIYIETGRRMCPECYEELLNMELKVFSYVRDHQGCEIEEIMEETGATMEIIRRMAREGYFDQANVKISYPCKKCGAPIYTGRICPKCVEQIQKNLQISMNAIKARATIQEQQKAVYKTMGKDRDKRSTKKKK